MIWERMKIIVEPSCSISLAMVIKNSNLFKNKYWPYNVWRQCKSKQSSLVMIRYYFYLSMSPFLIAQSDFGQAEIKTLTTMDIAYAGKIF